MTVDCSEASGGEPTLQDVAWQFNECLSLLRELRRDYVADIDAVEIDQALPDMQAALEWVTRKAAT
jgi:hypothetical protein